MGLLSQKINPHLSTAFFRTNNTNWLFRSQDLIARWSLHHHPSVFRNFHGLSEEREGFTFAQTRCLLFHVCRATNCRKWIVILHTPPLVYAPRRGFRCVLRSRHVQIGGPHAHVGSDLLRDLAVIQWASPRFTSNPGSRASNSQTRPMGLPTYAAPDRPPGNHPWPFLGWQSHGSCLGLVPPVQSKTRFRSPFFGLNRFLARMDRKDPGVFLFCGSFLNSCFYVRFLLLLVRHLLLVAMHLLLVATIAFQGTCYSFRFVDTFMTLWRKLFLPLAPSLAHQRES